MMAMLILPESFTLGKLNVKSLSVFITPSFSLKFAFALCSSFFNTKLIRLLQFQENSVPSMNNWNFESAFPMNYQPKSMGADNELVELLWRDGQVVPQSQATRNQVPDPAESNQVPKQHQPSLKGSDPCGTLGNSTGLIQDDETVSWIQYPFEDPFEMEINSNLFSEFAWSGPIETAEQIKQYEDKFVKTGSSDCTNVLSRSQQTQVDPAACQSITASQMPPPKLKYSESSHEEKIFGGSGKVTSSAQILVPPREGFFSSNANFGGVGNMVQEDDGQNSAMTVGASHCGSNQVQNDLDFSSSAIGHPNCAGLAVKDNEKKMVSVRERKETETLEPTLTSSGGSGGSSCRGSKQSTHVDIHKRKVRDKEISEYLSEPGELESAAGDKKTQKSKSARKSRAAEIHNLSERRRRDRINEKMKALQELIPHCNKADKASLLDEVIEYLKSLQLQLQVMWIGGPMAPMMFPGLQHYMSQMGMGISPVSLPPDAMHLQRIPLPADTNQAVPCQHPFLNAFNFQNQMQNPSLSEQYLRYLTFVQMHNASQSLNMLRFGPQALLPQGQKMPLPSYSSGALSGGTMANASFRGKLGLNN